MPSVQPEINQTKAGEVGAQEMMNSLSFSEAKMTQQNRSKIDLMLKTPPKWSNIAYCLYNNNPDKAKDFLVSLLKIDAKASESEKTAELLSILKEYSDHSVSHTEHVGQIFKAMKGIKNANGFEAFQDIDFEKIVLSMKMHDIGKLGMPDRILNNKEGMVYTKKDNKLKKIHPALGHLILKTLNFGEDSVRLALTHHLRYRTLPSGELDITGYPKKAFFKYCKKRHEKPELRPEDHLAAFADVFSASTDPNRRSDLDGTHKKELTKKERYELAFKAMDEKYFSDPFYKSFPLYLAFKKAMAETLERELKAAA